MTFLAPPVRSCPSVIVFVTDRLCRLKMRMALSEQPTTAMLRDWNAMHTILTFFVVVRMRPWNCRSSSSTE